MYSLSLVNVAVHPLSHSCPMDTSDPDAKDGKMCTFFALGGKFGMSSWAVCVDVIVALLGRRTLIPCLVGRMFVRLMFV